MADIELQFRDGTASEHASFTGANAELTVNTSNNSLHVHDGTTAGGNELTDRNLGNINAPAARANLAVLDTNNANAVYITQGTHTMWVPATAMVTRTTSGASRGTYETNTNKIMVNTLDFAAATDQYAQFTVKMPKSWDESTIQYNCTWSHNETVTAGNTSWALSGLALSNAGSIDSSFGTAVVANSIGTTSSQTMFFSETSAAVTIGGTPAEEDYVIFQVNRDTGNTGDTLNANAKLHGITLLVNLNAKDDS